MNINHLSVSRSQVWVECKQKYKFRYHLEVPSLEEEEPYFVYGKVVHKIIEEYTTCQGDRDIQEIVKGVLSGAIGLESESNPRIQLPQDYFDRLPGEIGAFLKLTKQIGTEGLIEHPFNFDLDPPNKKFLYGFMDRVILKDDRVFIIDYKTTRKSKFRKNQKTIVDDLQLRAYAMVACNDFNVEPSKVKVALYYLDGAELVAASFTQATLDSTKELLREMYLDIEQTQSDKVLGNFGPHCKRCSYRKVCPFFKGWV